MLEVGVRGVEQYESTITSLKHRWGSRLIGEIEDGYNNLSRRVEYQVTNGNRNGVMGLNRFEMFGKVF